jgi:hypothetical protein
MASIRRSHIAALLALPLLVAVAGCSTIQDAVTDGAKQVASSAAAVATAELTKQICAPVTDGTITAEDQQVISGLLVAAKKSGLADDLIASLEKVTAGTGVSPADVTSLEALCAATPAP